MKIEDLKKRYEDEWLFLKITMTDEQDRPIEGEVLLHSKNRDEIYEAQKEIVKFLVEIFCSPQCVHPQIPLCRFL